jgi:nucleoid DNA-binding protein
MRVVLHHPWATRLVRSLPHRKEYRSLFSRRVGRKAFVLGASFVATSQLRCYASVTLRDSPFVYVGDYAKAKVSVSGQTCEDEDVMARASATKPAAKTLKKAVTPVEKKATAPLAKKAATPVAKAAAPTPLKPIKDSFTKASLTVHLAERAGVEPKAAKALMAALKETVLALVHKKGAKEFTLPGLLKVVAQDVPAKKKRFGKDPFTGEDKWFAAKPASVRLKVRPLKKLKDAAL